MGTAWKELEERISPAATLRPASMQAGTILRLGCMGNRVYTGLATMKFILRSGARIWRRADALEVITGANQALQQYAEGRRGEIASA